MAMFGLQGSDLMRFGAGILSGDDLQSGLGRGVQMMLPAMEERQKAEQWKQQLASQQGLNPQMQQALSMMGPDKGAAVYAQHLFKQAEPPKSDRPWWAGPNGSIDPAMQKFKTLGQAPAGPTVYQQRAMAAEQQGLQRGSPEFRNFVLTNKLPEAAAQPNPPSGYRWNGDRLEAIAGGPATKLPAEGAARIAVMEQGLNDLGEAEKLLKDLPFYSGRRIGMATGTGDGGKAGRIVKGAIEGVLRGLTGAAATPQETDRLMSIYGPQADDTEDTIKEKFARLRDVISRQMSIMQRGRSESVDARDPSTMSDDDLRREFGQ